MYTGAIPASATRDLNSSVRSGGIRGGAQARGFDAKSWTASAPISRADCTTDRIPPGVRTCAPILTLRSHRIRGTGANDPQERWSEGTSQCGEDGDALSLVDPDAGVGELAHDGCPVRPRDHAHVNHEAGRLQPLFG